MAKAGTDVSAVAIATAGAPAAGDDVPEGWLPELHRNPFICDLYDPAECQNYFSAAGYACD